MRSIFPSLMGQLVNSNWKVILTELLNSLFLCYFCSPLTEYSTLDIKNVFSGNQLTIELENYTVNYVQSSCWYICIYSYLHLQMSVIT